LAHATPPRTPASVSCPRQPFNRVHESRGLFARDSPFEPRRFPGGWLVCVRGGSQHARQPTLSLSCIDGAYEIPMIAPSGVCILAIVCPQGSVRASCSRAYPLDCSSLAADATLSLSATSNSKLACGTGRSEGHSLVPRQAS